MAGIECLDYAHPLIPVAVDQHDLPIKGHALAVNWNLILCLLGLCSPASGQDPSIWVSPTNLSFSIAIGGSSTQQISLAGTAGVAWKASASNLIALTPSSGTGPGIISVVVKVPDNLVGYVTAGKYASLITISNPSALPTQETVTVDITFMGTLNFTSAALSFQTPQDSPAQSQMLQIGGSAARWQATATSSSGGNWLSVSPQAGPSLTNPVWSKNSICMNLKD